MASYIAFLRAINLGASRRVKMERLRAALVDLGYDNVRTYIASGNVFFDSPSRSKAALVKQIEARLEAEFGFAIPAMVRTVAEIEKTVARDSFKDIVLDKDTRFVVLFADGKVPTLKLPKESQKGDVTIVDATSSELFVVIRIIGGRVPNPGPAIKKELGVETTARFAHTLEKILAAAKS